MTRLYPDFSSKKLSIMKKKSKNYYKVGAFVSAAFAILIIAIIIIGREQNLFRDTIEIKSVFRDVKGLQIGNKVRFTGIEVGNVMDLIIESDTSVLVILSVDEKVIPFIKKNSRTTIGNQGLMGNKIVMILPGAAESEPISEGDFLKSVEPVEIDDIMNEIMVSSERISVVSENLIDITGKINRGEGVFGKIFTDTTFTKNLDRTSENTAVLTRNLIDITEKINRGEGVLGKVFTDSAFSMSMDSATRNIDLISSNLVDITRKISEGEGIFGRLFVDTTLTSRIYKTTINLENASNELQTVSRKFNDEDNALNKFIGDSLFADSLEVLLHNLNKSVISISEASDAVKRSGFIRLFSKKKDEDEKVSSKNEDDMKPED